MPRHQQPRELAELKGAVKVNPERYRTAIPKSKLPLGKPPPHMSKKAGACWSELSGMAIPGTMTGADRIMLELLSNLLAEYREEPEKFPVTKYTPMIGALARFGMSPSDRNKLGVTKPEPGANHWASLPAVND